MSEAQFIERCRRSSQESYEALEELAANLEDPLRRGESLAFFHGFAEKALRELTASEQAREYHFSLSKLALRLEDGGETRLLLLQLPSTFTPDKWSFTFFEGLTRYRSAEFQDQRIAELGCGIGWISIALAKQTRPAKIYGLDINPRAVTCSRINLCLNAYDAGGRPTWQHEGKTLDHVVEFHQSDLLEHCRKNRVLLDRVIGCIPQVPNPDPDFAARMLAGSVSGQASDELLHALSNYASAQGHLEDELGLGLIARAVEEAADVLRGSGKVILTLGGRPSTQVLERLFLRRGLKVQPIWNTRVAQAKDTDIHGLATIEERTPHRFEFYADHGGGVPVCARTALAYAEAGGEIAHGLSVYEARLREPLHVPRILQFLRRPGYEDARRAIDLSYPEDALAEEKMSVLSALAEELARPVPFPYGSSAGLASLRRRLSLFFGHYHRLHFDEAGFVVTPSSVATCANLLSIYRPRRALIDSQLARAMGVFPPATEALEIPRSADLACDLIERLRPELVFYTMPQVESWARGSFLRILEVSARVKTRVFIDISELIELSSTPSGNAVFQHLAQNPLPPHAALVCGLVKNKLYQDLEICFVVSQNRDLLQALTRAAELTYSRTPVLSQLHYDRILNDLLDFQIAEGSGSRGGPERSLAAEDAPFREGYIQVSAQAEAAFRHPAIVGEEVAHASPGAIRLDYGENCLHAPGALRRALFESFVKIRLTADESDPSRELLDFLSARFGLPAPRASQLALGGGTAPLFSGITAHCARAGTTLLFPSGAYGHFMASAHFHGARTAVIPTRFEDRFKVSGPALDQALRAAGRRSWVVLSAPVVNPTGAVYGAGELRELMATAARHDALVVLDVVFSGLEFEDAPVHLELPAGARWAVLGGLSKEFSAGGLRLGYGVSPDAEILHAWRQGRPAAPHATLLFTAKRLFGQLGRRDPELEVELGRQRAELAGRAQRLARMLERCGWQVLAPQGGLFLTAAPAGLLGKSHRGSPVTLETIAELLRERAGVIVNPPGWTGIPGHFRFVLSVAEQELDEALVRLERFSRELV